MSKLYEEVLHLIKVAAPLNADKPEIRLHPDDYDELCEELGIVPKDRTELATPGSWLINIAFVSDPEQTPGTARLVAE